MTLNKVQLIGRLTQDPELRTTQSGKSVVSFTVATSKKWRTQNGDTQEKSEFHNCSAWGKLAEIIAQYSTKGQRVYLEGELETQSWETDGVKKYHTQIVASNYIMLEKREKGLKSSQGGTEPEVEDGPRVEDIPF